MQLGGSGGLGSMHQSELAAQPAQCTWQEPPIWKGEWGWAIPMTSPEGFSMHMTLQGLASHTLLVQGNIHSPDAPPHPL